MKNLFPAWPTNRSLRGAVLALGLLSGSTVAHAQAPTSVYALGTVTQNGYVFVGTTYNTGDQLLATLNPAALSSTAPLITTAPVKITGITGNQQIVGIDMRPATGQLYALGYDKSRTTQNAQLYLLTPNGVLTPVAPGVLMDLNLADTDPANTRGLLPNIGFDFNPRADRLRVVAPNRTNYRLNPNTGVVVAPDDQLTYAAGSTVGHTPYIGTAAYTNSAVGLAGTTLYDIDVTNTNGLLSTQNPPNTGTLNPVNSVTFATNGSTSYAPLASPTIGLGLDIFYDRAGAQNLAYLIEARYSDPNNADPKNGGGPTGNDRFASNFYSLDLATGKATGKNIFGQIPVFLSDIAAVSTMPLTWNGSTSTAWNMPTNWTPNQVPTATDDVVIPGPGGTVRFQPTVSADQPARGIALSTGLNGSQSVLTLADGANLQVYGSFANNDGALASTGTGTGRISLVGGITQDIGGGALSTFPNLVVGTGTTATTSSAAAIVRGLTLTGNLNIGTSQLFTLLSSASNTAYVVNSGGAATGTATVQRYIATSAALTPPGNLGFGYRHYSAPVTNTTLSDLATSTFTPVFNTAYNTSTTPGTTTPYPTVYGYNQAQYESSPASAATPDFDKGYYSPASGSVAWASGTGYTVNLNGSELVDFQGMLANAPAGSPISTPPQGRNAAKPNSGWQLLGNPFPSSLNWDQVVASGLSGVDNAVYVFKSSGQYAGSYAAYVGGIRTNGGTSVIPVAQGFFVRTSVGAMGSLNFTNAQRITDGSTAPFQRTAADTRPQLLLELSNGTATSQTDVYFESGATTGFDKAYDAAALPFLNGLVLATQAGSDALAINGQPVLTGAVTVPLQVEVATAGTYALRAANLANLPTGYHAYLRDAVLNTYTDLATTPSVALSLTTTPAPGRYALLFTSASPLATAPAALAALANVYPSPAHGTATLLLPQALRGTSSSTVQLLNTLGQVVLTRTLAAGGPDSIELPLAGLSAGIYVVRATTAAGLVAKRLVIQ